MAAYIHSFANATFVIFYKISLLMKKTYYSAYILWNLPNGCFEMI